jgi:hypothetical protein
MRKSFLQNEKKDAQRKKYLAIAVGVFLIGIMAFSSIGYFYNPDGVTGGSGSFKEYGQTFTPIVTDQGTAYRTKFGDVTRDFYLLPTQVSYVQVSPDAQNVMTLLPTLQTIVIVVSPNSDFGQISFSAASLILSDLYDEKKQIVPAITEANASINSIPVISCDNQSYFDAQNLSGQLPIIQVQESNQTGIRIQDNCIIIEGSDGQGIISAAERLRYGMWGLDFTKEAVEIQ